MGKALTVRAIDTLKPGTSRQEIPDGLVGGLYLVLQPSGAKSWAVRYRNAQGTPRKHTFGGYPGIDLKSARELAQSALVDIARGADPGAEKKAARAAPKPSSDRDLVEKVADLFVERYAKANQRSWAETKRIIDREIVGRWRGRHLAEIGRADVHELLDAVVDRGAPIMANRVLAALRKMCGWAVDRGIITASPCDKLKAPSAERSRDRVLNDDELRKLWTACDGIGWPFGPLIRLLMLTGQRRDEVGQMRWSELDLDAGLWTLPRERAKNNTAHVVPLSAPALALLRALPRIEGSKRKDKDGIPVQAKAEDFVFTTSGITAVSGFGTAKTRLDKAMGENVPAWVIHDLRRSAASGMARLGVTLPTIEKVLNHVSGSFAGIVGVYQHHSYSDEKRHALDAWGAFVERLTTGQGGNVVALKAVG